MASESPDGMGWDGMDPTRIPHASVFNLQEHTITVHV